MRVTFSRHLDRAIILSIWMSAACLLGCGQGPETPCRTSEASALELPSLELAADVSHRNLKSWLETLTTPDLDGRRAGDVGSRRAAGWIARQMTTLGLAPGFEDELCQGFPLFEGEGYNVIARLPARRYGADTRRILVAAHYDGQGLHPLGHVYPGADDNASGVAALLEIARLAVQRREESSIEWTFIAMDAEEIGQLGARAYMARPSIDLSELTVAVHLDMVGRPLGLAESSPDDAPTIGYLAWGDSTSTTDLLRRAAATTDVTIRNLAGEADLEPAITDAEVFGERLPTLLLSTALHDDHHELSDTPDRIDYSQIERAVRLVLALAGIIADPS